MKEAELTKENLRRIRAFLAKGDGLRLVKSLAGAGHHLARELLEVSGKIEAEEEGA